MEKYTKQSYKPVYIMMCVLFAMTRNKEEMESDDHLCPEGITLPTHSKYTELSV